MINLKTEEFVLDMSTLQALQQLLQWVGDFVLHLLASLPNQVRPPPAPAAAAGPGRGRQRVQARLSPRRAPRCGPATASCGTAPRWASCGS